MNTVVAFRWLATWRNGMMYKLVKVILGTVAL